MSLPEWGWDDAWARALAASNHPEAMPCRVTRVDRRAILAAGKNGEVEVRVPRVWRSPRPAVGDWLLVRPQASLGVHEGLALLPRRSLLARAAAGERSEAQALAANVDVAFLVAGLDGDWNPRRLERYLALAIGARVAPVLVLNKADACRDVAARAEEARALTPNVPVLVASAWEGVGIDALRSYVGPGRTGILLGSSGVGKSSLVNRLLGEAVAEVGAVRGHDSRGRHTTTHRELHLLPGGGLLLDTPGMRELGLWGAEEGLHAVFADVDELAQGCRFRDCRHESEPGCAVRIALVEGQLDAARLAHWRKLQREAAFHARRSTEEGRRAQRQEARSFGRMTRHATAGKRARLGWDE